MLASDPPLAPCCGRPRAWALGARLWARARALNNCYAPPIYFAIRYLRHEDLQYFSFIMNSFVVTIQSGLHYSNECSKFYSNVFAVVDAQ